jgi:polyhydroxyalkanoate synthesis regulator phasin
MTMTRIAGTALGLALVIGFTAKAPAQTATNIELTRAYIQKARQTIIAEDMKLTEEESLAFWPAYRDYRVDMARLGDRLVKVIAEFVSAGASLNDEQATRLLDEYLDIKAKDVAVRQKHVKAFRKLLPASKVTRFFQLENKLDAVVNFELAQTVPLTH